MIVDPLLAEPLGLFVLEAEGYAVHAPTLPGRNPTDDHVLVRTGIEDCFAVALHAYDHIGEPAIVIGHSMGGLLTQKIAAARAPLAAAQRSSSRAGLSRVMRARRRYPCVVAMLFCRAWCITCSSSAPFR